MPRVLNLRDFPDGVPGGAIYCGSAMRQRRLSSSPFASPFKLRRDLACWCAPVPCHCDVLVRLVNPP